MIWTLRNISILFWITVSVTLPVSFYILTVLIQSFPGINPFVTGMVVAGICFTILTVLLDAGAKKILTGLIKEGQAWERAGIVKKAEKKYIRAVRLFDSFLFRPFGNQKIVKEISGIISRFELNTGAGNENFKTAACMYLKTDPSDTDMAELWLKQLARSSMVTSQQQEVLSILAETHGSDSELSRLIADIFLGLERKDFTAHKLYAQMQKNSGEGDRELKHTDQGGPIRDKDILDREAVVSSSKRLPGKPVKKRAWSLLKIGQGGWTGLKAALAKTSMVFKWLYRVSGSVISFIVLSVTGVADYVKNREQVRFFLKIGILAIAALWLIFFIAGTVSHLFKPTPIKNREQVIAEQVKIPKPFTIQVAAYLKQSHADRYVAVLKKKKIDARVKKVEGGGKTWFVIRVSEFDDKKSAAAYGQQLKQQNIIDDYFVNNN